ncbi:YceI family protein [Gelidibacter pelagius]|uniref:YceI family protein n=1 Tax=Gelidibacter pelagius TaxID=2819985 RepID=A0ABS3SPC8_9FLAO|nr:YceI family protein [Gelidibacter pelagius]MBO3097543.1 YceI family protein [Gelidibacter pelagius]
MNSTLILAMAFAASSFTTSIEKKVDVDNSKIIWKGHKVTGEHDGFIILQKGALQFDDKNQLTGGTFTMDMTTLTVTDLEGEMKGKLEAHLKSDDFFSTDKHTAATFVITNVSGKDGKYKVTGDLTIKGITNPNTFDMVVSGNTAKADLKVDRTKYDIKFRSASFFDNLKDKAIYDNFDLNVNLKF